MSRGCLLFGIVAALAACHQAAPAHVAAPAPAVARDAATEASPFRFLEDSVEYVFDAAGNYRKTLVERYRVLTTAGIELEGDFEAQWQPWYMSRPEVSVRVLDPRGGVHPLDPKTLVDGQVKETSPGVLSDAHVLRAPLPAMEVGSTVEKRVVWQTTKPYSPAGGVYHFNFGGPVPMDSVRMVVDVPESFPLAHRVLDAHVAFKEEKANGRRRLTFTGGPYEPLQGLESYQVPEVATWPHVAFSTGKSWREVARVYGELVDRVLAEGGDLGATVRGVVAASDPARVKAQKLLAWERARVRYADVEFGDASYEPGKPQETLRRGYGDCKDQAVLLTGLLRAGGLDANVALLRAESGEDLREDLPGLMGAFNHAIVRVGGKEPFFIDPTATFNPAGVLPDVEQGRFVLVASGDTEGLERLPASPAAANVYREQREVFLSSYGAGRVIETTTATGEIEAALRAQYAAPPSDLQKTFDDYAEKEYQVGKSVKVDIDAVNDLDKPFRLRLDAGDARHADTELTEASFMLNAFSVLAPLPRDLRSGDPRRTPAKLPYAFQSEVRTHIVPPAGFVAGELPKLQPVDVGPGKFSRTLSKANDGSILAVIRLEMPKARLEAKEVEALREGLRRLDDEGQMKLEFHHLGARLISEGKVREGIQAYQSVFASTTNPPIEHIRFADALLDAGFGDAARREARKAVDAAPNLSLTHQEYGFQLLHDPLGRQFSNGYDRAGAIAAFRKALQIDPKDASAQVDLAMVLERDVWGRRSRNPEDLRQAIAQYDAIDPKRLTNIGGSDFSYNVLELLMYMRRFDEVARRVSQRTDGGGNDFLAAAIAASRGAPTAIDEIMRKGLGEEKRLQILGSAATKLVSLQRYPEAVALYEAAARGGADADTYRKAAAYWRGVRHHELEPMDDKTPEGFLKGAVLRTFQGKNDGAPLFAASSDLAPKDMNAFLEKTRETFASALKGTEVETGVDVLLSGWKLSRETNGPLEVMHAAIGGKNLEFYLLHEGNAYRLYSMDEHAQAVACSGALHAIGQQKDADAKPWLAWGKKSAQASSAGLAAFLDPLAAPPIVRVWGAGGSDDVRAAAGSLCAYIGDARRAVGLLVEARNRISEPAQLLAVDQALAFAALRAEDAPRALEASDRVLSAAPRSTMALELRVRALRLANRRDDVRNLVQKELAKDSRNSFLLETKARVEEASDNIDAAMKWWQKIIDSGHATSTDYNNAAWATLFRGKTTEQPDIDMALQAVQMSNYEDPFSLHTLAMLYADAGRLSEARETLRSVVDRRPGHVLDPVDWLVIGRLAEQYGLDDIARDAYDRVAKSGNDAGATSSKLAQKRRAVLGKPALARAQ